MLLYFIKVGNRSIHVDWLSWITWWCNIAQTNLITNTIFRPKLRANFTNIDWIKSWHGWIITRPAKFGIESFIHSQTSKVQPLEFNFIHVSNYRPEICWLGMGSILKSLVIYTQGIYIWSSLFLQMFDHLKALDRPSTGIALSTKFDLLYSASL